jgi:protein-L-isoaspartate(D-aspartate) O-methyltransferase
VLVALDAARQLNNGQPSGLAFLIEAMELNPDDHVVHLGCGTGYYTAIMAHVVGEAGRVTAVELDGNLANRAPKTSVHSDRWPLSPLTRRNTSLTQPTRFS